MTPLLSLLVGACVGSLLNVCLARWKSGGKIASPSSFCHHCKKSIIWYDKIPILSFVRLRGKCRFCYKSISLQYPLVESTTAFFFGFSAMFFSKQAFFLICSFIFVGFLILLSTSDIKWRLLPHPFNNFFILSGFIFSCRSFFPSVNTLFIASGNFFIVGTLMFLLTRYFPLWMGGGDVKMLAGLAVWLGVFSAFYVLLIASGTALLLFLAMFLMGAHKITLKTVIPFGPFLSFGALVVWFWPEFVLHKGMLP